MDLSKAKYLQSMLWDQVSKILKEKKNIKETATARYQGVLKIKNRLESKHPWVLDEVILEKPEFIYYFPGLEEFSTDNFWRTLHVAVVKEQQKNPKDTKHIIKLKYIRTLISLDDKEQEKDQAGYKISKLEKEEKELYRKIRHIYAQFPEEFFGPEGPPKGFFDTSDNDSINESNRHVSHLGGLGSGDGLSTSLNQDINPPKISGGGFEGTADSKFSKNIGQLRVHIDDNGDLMFPENENIETVRKKDEIRGKVPFDGRYKMRESKKTKKTLIDLFDDKYFEEEEDATHFKKFDTNKDLPDDFKLGLANEEIKDNLNVNRKFDNPTQKASKLSASQLTKKIKKEVFNQIKNSAEEKGMRLVLKENSSCMECGMMYESCMCEEETIEEFNALAAGGVAGYQTKMTTPKNMKKHMKKMLPTGYKYR